jgi:hypothetical protein
MSGKLNAISEFSPVGAAAHFPPLKAVLPQGNLAGRKNVYRGVMGWKGSLLLLLTAAIAVGAYDSYLSAKRKFDLIESDGLRAGSRVDLTYPELDAWVAHEAPDGVRNPRIQVISPGMATGSALIDFAKVRRAQGSEPGWLMSKLLEGERPVSVTAQVRSSGGTATVDVERVVISGVTIDGRTLDFLIQNVLQPLYPNAAIGKPFALSHRIERLSVAPAAVGVVIGK